GSGRVRDVLRDKARSGGGGATGAAPRICPVDPRCSVAGGGDSRLRFIGARLRKDIPMKPSRIAVRSGISWMPACALFLFSPASAAQVAGPSGPACKVAYQDAERQEQDGRLVEARKLLAGCARAACGKG